MRSLARIALLLVTLVSVAVPAYAITPDVSLSSIRAIRISATSISFSFITDIPATGQVEYKGLDGSDITLTDSVQQVDHLFTIDELDPSRGYTFLLTASSGTHISNTYSILLAPELIGESGQSIVPPVEVISPSGEKVSSSLAASTTPAASNAPPAWIFILTIIAVAGAWGAYKVLKMRNSSHSLYTGNMKTF